VIERLVPEYKVSLLFYNPNIEPRAEYDKRKEELIKLLKIISPTSDVLLLESDYNNAIFQSAASSLQDEPEGGARCRVCFELRLSETAARAKAGGFDAFASTLSVSPHKNASVINDLGEQLGQEFGIKYLHSDFKRDGGFKRSVELSKQYGLYRQNYCGCIWSKR